MKVKNLLVLIIIYVFTILLVLYGVALYKKSSDLVVNESSMNKIIKEISEREYEGIYSNINNYIVENHSFFLYINSSDDKYFEYECELKQIIIDNNMEDNFIYINTDNIKNYDVLNRLIVDFSDNIDVGIDKKDVPLFIYFKDGVIYTVIVNNDLNLDVLREQFVELGVM